MTDTFPSSIQVSLLALLAFDEKHGAHAAAILQADYFDAPLYNEMARKLIDYWRENHAPPGPAHVDDVFGFMLERGDRAQELRKVLGAIIDQWDKGEINPEFVLRRSQRFVRGQLQKAAIAAAVDRVVAGGEQMVEDVDALLHKALSQRAYDHDPGIFVGDPKRALSYLDNQRNDVLTIGMTHLNQAGVGVGPGEMLLYVAPKGSGKTWFCVHMGQRAAGFGHKVLHITLEHAVDKVVARYHQCLFDGGYADHYIEPKLRFEDKQLRPASGHPKLTEVENSEQRKEVAIDFRQDTAEFKLRKEMEIIEDRLSRILVRQFPTGHLTVSQLVGYLDALESINNFVPDLLIVDYPDLMRFDSRDFRINLGQVFKDLRGIAAERRMRLICPTQGNRRSLNATRVGREMVSEAVDKLHTSDTVLTYSQTDDERAKGLARLYVADSRNTAKGQLMVFTQAYTVGKWLIAAHPIPDNYFAGLSAEEAEE